MKREWTQEELKEKAAELFQDDVLHEDLLQNYSRGLLREDAFISRLQYLKQRAEMNAPYQLDTSDYGEAG